MAFGAAYTCKKKRKKIYIYILARTYPKRGREKIVLYTTLAVKLCQRKFSKNVVSGLNEDIG